jgi:hypothetical protein
VQACVEVIKARYWPCLGVKDFLRRLTPAIRFSCSSVPRCEEARMNVRYRVELNQTEPADPLKDPACHESQTTPEDALSLATFRRK